MAGEIAVAAATPLIEQRLQGAARQDVGETRLAASGRPCWKEGL